jgi:hypothetical protein
MMKMTSKKTWALKKKNQVNLLNLDWSLKPRNLSNSRLGLNKKVQFPTYLILKDEIKKNKLSKWKKNSNMNGDRIW